MKYRVKTVSTKCLSCGITLSNCTRTLVCLLPRAMRAMVPKHGAMKGVQYLSISASGRSRLIRRPTFIQLGGQTVFTARTMSMPSGASDSLYWLLPGKRIFGYCTVKVSSLHFAPRPTNVAQSRSIMVAMPPRYGYAGPSRVIFFIVGNTLRGRFSESPRSLARRDCSLAAEPANRRRR